MPRKRRFRFNWPFFIASLTTLVLLGLLIAWRIAIRTSSRSLSTAEWQLAAVAGCIESVIAAWFMCTGAAIGSFINVVAWRLPRGLSLLGASRCPHCRAELSWKDNFPVFGWLGRRGRSSCCRLPIAPRYLWIELFFLSVFGWICINELLSYGANLPTQPFLQKMALEHRLTTTTFGIQLLVYVWVESGLVAVALMSLQKSKIPWHFYGWFAVPCLLIPLLAPSIIQVPWQGAKGQAWLPPGADAMLSGAIGLLAGSLAGVAGARVWAISVAKDSSAVELGSAAGATAMAGMLLGWQAVPVIVLMSYVCGLGARLVVSSKFLSNWSSTHSDVATNLSQLSVWIWLAVLVYRSTWTTWYSISP